MGREDDGFAAEADGERESNGAGGDEVRGEVTELLCFRGKGELRRWDEEWEEA